MDFSDSKEEKQFRLQVREWLEANLPQERPVARAGKLEDDDEWFSFMKDWASTLCQGGFAGLAWPKEYGGGGATVREQIIFGEELSRLGAPFHIDIVGLGMAGPTLMFHGTEEQRKRHLPRILDGSEIWCQLWSEPDAGSDLAAVKTKALRDGDDWVISGQKVWTTIAHRCRWGLLLARSDPNQPKHRGLTYFICDMSSEGVTVRPIRGMDGDNEFSEVFLDGVRVPDANRIGEVGEGWKVMTTSLMLERFAIGGGAINYPDDFQSVAEIILKQGRQDDRLVRQRLARLYCDVLSLKVLGYRLMTAVDSGQEPGPEGSIVKLLGSEFNVRLYDLAMDVLGEAGLEADSQIAKRYLRSRGSTIEGGTSEIMRNLLGERVLGLPREPKPSEGVTQDRVKGAGH